MKQRPNNTDNLTYRVCDIAISQISLHPRGCFRQTESFITSPVCKKNEWFLGKAELEGFSLEWTYLGKNVLAF